MQRLVGSISHRAFALFSEREAEAATHCNTLSGQMSCTQQQCDPFSGSGSTLLDFCAPNPSSNGRSGGSGSSTGHGTVTPPSKSHFLLPQNSGSNRSHNTPTICMVASLKQQTQWPPPTSSSSSLVKDTLSPQVHSANIGHLDTMALILVRRNPPVFMSRGSNLAADNAEEAEEEEESHMHMASAAASNKSSTDITMTTNSLTRSPPPIDAGTPSFHSCLVDYPPTSVVIRACLRASTASQSEADCAECMSLCPGMTNFRVSLAGVPFRVQTKRVMVARPALQSRLSSSSSSASSSKRNLKQPPNGVSSASPAAAAASIITTASSGKTAMATWCTWRAPPAVGNAPTAQVWDCDFWVTDASVDIGYFVKAYHHARCHTLPPNVKTLPLHYTADCWPTSLWTTGHMSCGEVETRFYRIDNARPSALF